MMESILLKASAGSGKTSRLTREVFERISAGGKFILALTFTRAATAEMRSRIMELIASEKGRPLLDRMRLIMEAGRVGYSTIDAFFYRLFAAVNDAPRMADEKAQIDLAREIEKRFRDGIARSGAEKRLIIAARILNTDLDLLWSSLGDEQTVERCLLEMERLDDLESLMMENVLLLRELDSLGRAASALAEGMPKRINEWVIAAMAEYDRFMSSALSGYPDLGQYASLGKNIVWHRSPYSDLNRIFQEYRKTAEKLSLNKALLRELAVAFLCGIYLDAANAVKEEKGVIFFADVRKSLLALDGAASRERPKLMGSYFSLGLDRTEHLLVDEFQDTSTGDMAILLPLVDEILSGPGERGERSFFAVGDWKQMIYAWRGANREALEAAIGGYLQNGVIREQSLPHNYRSTPLLISFFNKLVENLFEGGEKTETQTPPEENRGASEGVSEVSLVQLERQGASEAPWYPAIVEYLQKKKEEYGCSWGDMAVLALTNNSVQKIEAELVAHGIRVSSVKGRQLLSTEEGVSVMLFLTMVLSREGRGAFAAEAAASPLWKERFGNALEIRDEFPAQFPRPFGLAAVSLAIERLRGKVSAVILNIWQDEALAFFGEGGADADEFLARMFRVRWSVRVPEGEDRDSIKVDTVHGTKGLQFAHVFVFWNEEERSDSFYLPSQKCHVRFSAGETKCLQAGGSNGAREIIEKQNLHLLRMRLERANVFYVAATRAIRTLAVFLPVIKSGEYKTVHQAVLKTFEQFVPEGTKSEQGRFSPLREEGKRTAVWDAPPRRGSEPDPYGEIDPALVSESIKAGIARGERLHRWLARVLDPDRLPPRGELNPEEYDTAVRFVRRKEVSELLFGPGRLYLEQPISDKNDFGVVDRMIVSEHTVTIMDYKSGSLRGLKRKYEEQKERYTRIMKSLYPSRTVAYHILSIDP